jgi:hypothetical protein
VSYSLRALAPVSATGAALLITGSAPAQNLIPTSFGKTNRACKLYANSAGAPFKTASGQFVTNTPGACAKGSRAGTIIQGSFSGGRLRAGSESYNIGPDGNPR